MAQDGADFGLQYERVRELGSGAFGTAQLMRDRGTGELVAVKYIPLRYVDHRTERELLNHRKLSVGGHPNVVQFKKAFVTSTHLAIAMEYASGGDLFTYAIEARGRLDEDTARFYFQQLIGGLAYCHSRVVSHRDIKLENTLLEDRSARPAAKICDFGYSKDGILNSTPDTVCGTSAYMAPEVLAGGEYNGRPVDVWACGVALFVMLVGDLPFVDPANRNSNQRMIARINAVQYHFPRGLQLSEGCVNLIRRIFVFDPQERISLQAVQQDPWFLTNLLPGFFQNGGMPGQLGQPAQSEEELVAVVLLAQQAYQAQLAQLAQLNGDLMMDDHLLDDGADLEFVVE
ncbi:sucrose nonfermenting 1(SNF1)-related kinase [Chlorella sorokiniana]|uniref:Sucrose nonfermenting 1(SNF1)-related kinase n=1 Tax=Chlorella sorokiniana TaxID=3076 RepID=A0A2P6TWN2_CHLSO|nr:sucrose nonfermenting 1(SNF1)-related kinase [Chlorella sorokiniana]|eukprot:PRW58457.1 sucrose nonfermenting 1(SNF1)-related kinase [Chlorella sorokiniana]